MAPMLNELHLLLQLMILWLVIETTVASAEWNLHPYEWTSLAPVGLDVAFAQVFCVFVL